MSDSMPARLAVTRQPLGHRRRCCRSRRSACRFCCQPSQGLDDGSGALDDGSPLDGSPVGDEPEAVGVGSLPLGADDCVGGSSDGVGTSDAEELVGVGVGVLVGGATGQVGTFVLV
jgi:hypothetical protein